MTDTELYALTNTRWSKLTNYCGKSFKFDNIHNVYTEPHRHYHTLEHIVSCFNEFDEVRHLIPNPLQVELALFFHDYVYDTHAGDNEKKSAEVCIEVGDCLGIKTVGVLAAHIIMLTSHKDANVADFNTRYALDIDLAILGRSSEEFDKFEKGIRKEYAWVEESAYRSARVEIMKKFLDRKRIYYTNYFCDKYEESARKNIQELIERLK